MLTLFYSSEKLEMTRHHFHNILKWGLAQNVDFVSPALSMPNPAHLLAAFWQCLCSICCAPYQCMCGMFPRRLSTFISWKGREIMNGWKLFCWTRKSRKDIWGTMGERDCILHPFENNVSKYSPNPAHFSFAPQFRCCPPTTGSISLQLPPQFSYKEDRREELRQLAWMAPFPISPSSSFSVFWYHRNGRWGQLLLNFQETESQAGGTSVLTSSCPFLLECVVRKLERRG